MTAKEKAGDLVLKFYTKIYEVDVVKEHSEDSTGWREEAKQCALIAVDEIINSTWKKETYIKRFRLISVASYTTTEYWQQVKDEINKL